MKKNIGIFCSSSNALDDDFYKLAQNIGKSIAIEGFNLVTGGANVGLMKVLTDSAKKFGAQTIGVIPKVIFSKELAYHSNDKLIITENLAQRKQKIIQLSDAFIALPGGFGTLDELLEVIVLKQLNIIQKPIVIFNYKNFFSDLINQFEKFFDLNFAKKKHKNIYFLTDSISLAINYIKNYQGNDTDKHWFAVDKKDF